MNSSLNLFARCCLGLGLALLVACAPPDSNVGHGFKADTTLSLTKLDNGNYQYCDPSGVCHELPGTGADCATIDIQIDTATGETCQSCTQADGTNVDQGCVGTSVACVLVTVPNPDCVVCAYVNGAVIYSSCNPGEAQCRTDADCNSIEPPLAGGMTPTEPACDGPDCNFKRPPAGRCDAGTCVYDSRGCMSDAECGAGMFCQPTMCPVMDCAPSAGDASGSNSASAGSGSASGSSGSSSGSSGGSGPGTPDAPPPTDGSCPPSPPCDSFPGQCMPLPTDPCLAALCAPGTHCEAEIDCMADSTGGPSACVQQAVCVADPTPCSTDSDCTDGNVCLDILCYACDPIPGEPNPCPSPACQGRCGAPAPTCDDVVCAPGSHCEMTSRCVIPPMDPSSPPPPSGDFPTCVADPAPVCQSDADCGGSATCVDIVCYDCAYDPSGATNCPMPACQGHCQASTCTSDSECAAGESCQKTMCPMVPCTIDSAGNVSCPPCLGTCAPVSPDPCVGITCGAGFVCQAQAVECIAAPCDPVPVCVAEGPVDCNAGHALCAMPPPPCAIGQAASVIDGCWGGCVPREQCAP